MLSALFGVRWPVRFPNFSWFFIGCFRFRLPILFYKLLQNVIANPSRGSPLRFCNAGRGASILGNLSATCQAYPMRSSQFPDALGASNTTNRTFDLPWPYWTAQRAISSPPRPAKRLCSGQQKAPTSEGRGCKIVLRWEFMRGELCSNHALFYTC